MTGRDFLFQVCDEKFWESDLNEQGLAFTNYYYAVEDGSSLYFEDYDAALVNDLPSLYHVEDTWSNYDKISKVINQRFHEWQAQQHA
jgi:uncharacterized protein YbcV (DUF1398 family)